MAAPDPSIVIAALSFAGAAYAAWQSTRKDEATAKITADANILTVELEAGVKKQELLDASLAAHLHRLEKRADDAEARLAQIESELAAVKDSERKLMIWATIQDVWPPDTVDGGQQLWDSL